MIMHSLLIFIFLNINNFFSSDIQNTSWVFESDSDFEVRIYSDKFFTVVRYDNNNIFISTSGGIFSTDNGYYELLEYNSLDSSLVGDTLFYSNVNIEAINGKEFLKIDDKTFSKNIAKSQLSGSWLMSGIERRGEMRMRDVNKPRKTMKILAGNRFQWIAYDIYKKGFYGSGGGTYSTKNGKYVENIEFFSRDKDTVGKSLEFDFEIKEGDWHHIGFSSKGDPKYEIWTKRRK